MPGKRASILDKDYNREEYVLGGVPMLLRAVGQFASKVLKPRNLGQEQIKKAAQQTAEYAKGQAKAAAAGSATTVGVGGLIYNISNDELPTVIEKAKAEDIELKIIDERINPADYPVYKKDSDSAKAFRQMQREAKKAGATFFEFEGRPYNTREKKAKGSLVGSQKKLDLNKNNKIDKEDFSMLREKKAAGSKVITKNIIDFAEKLMAKEAPKKAAERRAAIKSSAEAEDIIVNKINSDPFAMDEVPLSILENLSVKNKAKIGLADEYSADIAESTGGMLKEMSPKEAAENLLAFEDDEIFDYMSTLNARDLRQFKDNLSDDDFEAFGDYMPDLGPREQKNIGSKIAKKILNSKNRKKLLKMADDLEFVDSPEPDGKTAKEFKKDFKDFVNEKTPGVSLMSRQLDVNKDLDDLVDEYFMGLREGNNGDVITDRSFKLLETLTPRDRKAEGSLLGSMEGKEKEAVKAIIINKLTDMQDPSSKSRNDSLVYLQKADPSLVMSAIGQTVSPEDQRQIRTQIFGRQERQEGGSMLVPPEMPVDTYTPAEQANAAENMLPDGEMEDNYMDYVLEESLESDEQDYLMDALESDPKLSDIFDKVLMTASEFSGAGEVEGPGTGVSDSIPARLSDGEFVITKKATDQIGANNLQRMMDDAERMADGGVAREGRQFGGMLGMPKNPEEELEAMSQMRSTDDEINQAMLRSNQVPSLRRY